MNEYVVLPNGCEAHWEVVERILFIYAKLNPGIAYVQGMNEIVGPLYYMSGEFWGSQEGCQGPFRPSGRNRGLPLRRRGGCSWDSPGKNAGVGCHILLLEIFLTQGLNPGLLHCRHPEARRGSQGASRAAPGKS